MIGDVPLFSPLLPRILKWRTTIAGARNDRFTDPEKYDTAYDDGTKLMVELIQERNILARRISDAYERLRKSDRPEAIDACILLCGGSLNEDG